MVVVDGSYTNNTVLRSLPERVTVIGRIRGDAALHAVAAPPSGRLGRTRVYGPRQPTPEQLRQDPEIPWQTVTAYAAGRQHQFSVKVVRPLRWRPATGRHTLQLVIIRPLAYRKTRHGKVLYRRPAYLICTDPEMPIQRLLQAYLWRWDIEVNFRDEKTLLGVGQAQVRHPASVAAVPAMTVAAYAMLLLAGRRAFGDQAPDLLPPPKWRRRVPPPRATTSSLRSHLRHELWARALGQPTFSGFAPSNKRRTKSEKRAPDLAAAVLYAN